MKISILVITLCSLTTVALVTSCSSSAENVEKAAKDMIEANKDLAEANEIYLADIENHKIIMAEKIGDNQKSIEDFNKRILAEKKEAKADYKKRIAELEAKNSDMKKRMEDYQAEGEEKWDIFKMEFNHEMDELREGLKDLTNNETK